MGEKIDETRNNTNDKVNCLTKHSTKQPPQANECRKDMDLKVSKKKKVYQTLCLVSNSQQLTDYIVMSI